MSMRVTLLVCVGWCWWCLGLWCGVVVGVWGVGVWVGVWWWGVGGGGGGCKEGTVSTTYVQHHSVHPVHVRNCNGVQKHQSINFSINNSYKPSI